MKRVLFSVLMLAVFSSTLMCGMSICMKPAQAASSPPCHGQNTDGEDAGALMFMTDCMGIDFQVASDDISIEKPHQQIDKITYALAGEMLSSSFLLADQNTIRGPPDRENIRNTLPSLILTTQRFRI